MKIKILWTGTAKDDNIRSLIIDYRNRLKHYANVEIVELNKRQKANTPAVIKNKDAESLLKQIQSGDYVVLLDEKGKQLTSEKFASFLQHRMNHSSKGLVFIIGGPYGFDQMLYDRADNLLSLSKMTFTHDMVRVILFEQLYRAFTILRGEKYHNP